MYCRICRFSTYNECDAFHKYDYVIDFNVHKNAGEASYCACCGKPTMLLNEKMLKSYTEVQALSSFNDEFIFN